MLSCKAWQYLRGFAQELSLDKYASTVMQCHSNTSLQWNTSYITTAGMWLYPVSNLLWQSLGQ